jgi:hypothetical protein
MRVKPAIAGLVAGAVLGLGVVAAFDAASVDAEAQEDDEITRVELDAANARSIRAIKQGTKAWNLVAKYLAEPGERIAVKSPRISQQPGIGGGLPEGVLSAEVRAKLNGGGTPGPAGVAGPQGPPGPPGPSGDSGPQNVVPFVIRMNTTDPRVEFAKSGGLSLEADCADLGGGTVQAQILGKTITPQTVMWGTNVYTGQGTNPFLTRTTPDAQRVFIGPVADAGQQVFSPGGFFGALLAPNGAYVGVSGNATLFGVNYGGSDCVFAGSYALLEP